MQIELTKEQMKSIDDKKPLIVDGEKWEYVCEDREVEENEDGKSYSFIYKRPSDNRYFNVTIYYCRYGYKDYGYEDYTQDNTAYEVEGKEIVKYEWVYVK